MKELKTKHKAFISRQNRTKHALMNQPIHIRDMIITTEKAFSHGEESIHTNTYSASCKERLRRHLHFLFDFANADHRAHYFEMIDGAYQLKEDKQNHVTRLLTSEFSFYTDTPYTRETFQDLVDAILLEHLEPNVHVLLSSFAFKDLNGKLLNMVLYVEGGSPPIIHSFVKNTAYSIDRTYGRLELFSQQKRGYLVSFHAEVSTTDTGLSIPMSGVFEMTTQGGASFMQIVDICSDHASGHAKALMMRQLRHEENSDQLFPEQIEHCISSNSVTRTKKNSISDCVIQADSNVRVHGNQGLRLGERTLTEEAREAIIPPDYPSLSIIDDPLGYKILNPIFGSDYTVEVLAERPAGQYLPEIQRDVVLHNQRLCEEIQETSAHGLRKG